MALTLFAFVAVRLAVTLLARPRFLPPERRTSPVAGGDDPLRPGDWLLSASVHDATGQRIHEGMSSCATSADACVDKFTATPLRGAYNLVVYQPVDRFWSFQIIETGVYVLLAGVLVALAVHRVRRSIS
jgi:hypothetical protein